MRDAPEVTVTWRHSLSLTREARPPARRTVPLLIFKSFFASRGFKSQECRRATGREFCIFRTRDTRPLCASGASFAGRTRGGRLFYQVHHVQPLHVRGCPKWRSRCWLPQVAGAYTGKPSRDSNPIGLARPGTQLHRGVFEPNCRGKVHECVRDSCNLARDCG